MPRTPEDIRAYKRAWAQANHERINIQQKANRAKALAKDPGKVRAQEQEKQERYRQRHPDRVIASQKKRLTEAKQYSAQYYQEHKTETYARLVEWRKAHPEEYAAQITRSTNKHSQWRKDHPEEARAYDAAQYAKHSKQSATKGRRWRAEHPEKVHEYVRKRRAEKHNAPINDFTAAQWQEMKEHYGYKCVYCGRKMQRLTQDHITPLSQGGSHTASNIVPACQSCNSKKRAGAPLVPVQPLLFTIQPSRAKRRRQ